MRPAGNGIGRKAHLDGVSSLATRLGLSGQPRVVAVKEIKLPGNDASDLKRYFTREALVWSRIKGHPGILQFFGFCADFVRKEAWLVSSWEPYGNVREFIQGRDLEVPEKLSLANVLVNSKYRAVLCDFGQSRLYEDSELVSPPDFGDIWFEGSTRWCIPELLNGEGRTASGDIFAWAWLVWEPHCPPTLETADPHKRSPALLESLGVIESWKGNHDAGFAYLERALDLYEEERNGKGVASVLRKQAAASDRGSNLVKCRNAASAALKTCRSLRDDIGVADALYWMALAEPHSVGAKGKLQESLKIFQVRGNSRGVAKCLQGLGEQYRREGRAEEAVSTLEEALDVASRRGDRLGEANALIALGVTNKHLDYIDNAISAFERAHDIAKNIGWEPGLSTCLGHLGIVKLQHGIHAEAERLLHESVSVARHCDAGWRLGQALFWLGMCFRQQDRIQEATSALEESCSIHQNIALDIDPRLAETAALLADSKFALGLIEEALAWYDTAIAEWRKCENEVEVSKCLSASDAILVQAPLVDDIGSFILSVSQDPVKINGHFCDLFEGVHTIAGRVALKRPRIGGTGYDAIAIRLCEAAYAVSYLHDSQVIHGDIKGSNILINDNGHSLLCDFGLSRETRSKTSTAMRGAGTVRWQSPELWEDVPKSFGSDVYAFAMTIVE
ncbi:hypothetical protein FRC01_002196, partial [Tulasnella sp. 417]